MEKVRALLLTVWGALLWGHRLFGPADGPDFERIPTWARMTSSSVLVLYAVLVLPSMRDADLRKLARAMAIGMAFGLVGDLLLAGVLGLQGPAALGAGMVVFGIGHGFYLKGMRAVGPWPWKPIVGAMVVVLAGWLVNVMGGTSPSPLLTVGALVYGLLLGAVLGMATGIALRERPFWTMAIGAAVFLVSDLVLSLHFFRPDVYAQIPVHIRGDLVWLLYAAGQVSLLSAAPYVQKRRVALGRV